MSDYHDYNENLAFPPQGDWSDTQPKFHTDRTASTIELVDKIEKLSKQLEIAISGFDWIRNLNRFVDFGSRNKATVVLTTLAKDGCETAKQALREDNIILSIENIHLKELLRECKPFVELCNSTPENKKLIENINSLLGDKTDIKELEK